jgi:AraC-like DNA-binding protein
MFELSGPSLARRAGLSPTLFDADPIFVSSEAWAALWDALEAEIPRPTLPLELAETISFEFFSPAIFAVLCSENFSQAARRLQRYKSLLGPCRLSLEETGNLRIGCKILGEPIVPRLWGLTELAIWTRLIRHCTGHPVVPKQAFAPNGGAMATTLKAFLGVPVTPGERFELVFYQADALRPFRTRDNALWASVAPALDHRLADCNEQSSEEERVRAALFELLPSGRSTLKTVAQELNTSPRTLQRRLAEEGLSFRHVLDNTRAQLAKHYLKRTQLTKAEIAFLLGYEDPNSFYPAFRSWTGTTPQALRQGLQRWSAAPRPGPWESLPR